MACDTKTPSAARARAPQSSRVKTRQEVVGVERVPPGVPGGTGGATAELPTAGLQRRRKPARRTRRSSINKSVSQRWPTRTDVEDVDARSPLVDDKNCDVVLTELDPLVRHSGHGEDPLDLGVCAPQCSGKSV